ncbi:CueP family metal-binding protein [Bacillus sp. FJAT-49711]|uniref:CueP family metal-binding protein n=1 Tax=Bacillus sp. FJAT-49711 TaxID=2833585 RepID=UPI001BC908E1|nr:CueP family metal-binding protein [Bacillus sp. FJAT-49711]MBS4219658.1 CueP family metal-binding protein [Bacillus sp. FJAT-49711]
MKLKFTVVIWLIAIIVLVACSGKNINEDNKTQNIKELVHDYSVGNNKNSQTASITSNELIVTNSDESKKVFDLPEDEFFVSIAPFINETHPCKIHSLTGCQGEMTEKEFDVYIEDEDGNVVLDKTLKSQANGFIDLWLPRDKQYLIMINHEGKKVESTFSTFNGDGTCITTMQLT